MDKQTLKNIQRTIGYVFKNERLLEQAFIRKSYAQERHGCLDNEKLEFYGDAALDYYVTRSLCKKYSSINNNGQFCSTKSEKDLTEIRSSNVDTETLAHCILVTGFHNHLLMNESDKKNKAQISTSVMADLFEAIVGAVAIDCDWNYDDIADACRNLLNLSNLEINYIKWLDRWCSERGYSEPQYYSQINMFEVQKKLQRKKNPNMFFNYDQSTFSDITGASLYIRELNIHVGSNLSQLYTAYMDCAKQVYEKVQGMEMIETAGKPSLNTAINQLNVLYQKGLIEEPEYSFEELHDEDGNPVWHCDCDLDELEDLFYGESSMKKEAKKEAAYSALCELLGYEPEELDDWDEDDD